MSKLDRALSVPQSQLRHVAIINPDAKIQKWLKNLGDAERDDDKREFCFESDYSTKDSEESEEEGNELGYKARRRKEEDGEGTERTTSVSIAQLLHAQRGKRVQDHQVNVLVPWYLQPSSFVSIVDQAIAEQKSPWEVYDTRWELLLQHGTNTQPQSYNPLQNSKLPPKPKPEPLNLNLTLSLEHLPWPTLSTSRPNLNALPDFTTENVLAFLSAGLASTPDPFTVEFKQVDKETVRERAKKEIMRFHGSGRRGWIKRVVREHQHQRARVLIEQLVEILLEIRRRIVPMEGGGGSGGGNGGGGRGHI